MHRLIWVILCALPLTLTAAPTQNVTQFVFGRVTQNEDGTPLDDLTGRKIYCGVQSGEYNIERDFPDANIQQTLISSVVTEDGTYYCAETAYNSQGHESNYSNEVSFFLIDGQARPRPVPAAPIGFDLK